MNKTLIAACIFWAIIIGIAGFAIGRFMTKSENQKDPRKMNGKTILRTADSVYFISFKIDSVDEIIYED
jgi:hypothetical protein